jgi:hypothetical protein
MTRTSELTRRDEATARIGQALAHMSIENAAYGVSYAVNQILGRLLLRGSDLAPAVEHAGMFGDQIVSAVALVLALRPDRLQ